VLEELVLGPWAQAVDVYEDGEMLFAVAAQSIGLEGVVAKRRPH
jgi:hypothetical protein